MNDYIRQWNEVIVNGSVDNTYKMAWARSIIELCLEKEKPQNEVVFDFKEIAKKYIKFYWNQEIFFGLIQSSSIKKSPVVLQKVQNLIESYYDTCEDRIPMRFERIENKLPQDELQKLIEAVAKDLRGNVCWRFLNVGKESYELYRLDEKKEKVFIDAEKVLLLKEYSDLLFQVINYRWTQILENFNTSPKISMKVRAVNGDKEISRKNLREFHKYLNYEFKDGVIRCFHCGEKIEEGQVSVDHIIPWSFMFSDDLWNLVYCHKSENSSKSNSIINEEGIKKLEERSRKLLETCEIEGVDGKIIDELRLSIEKDYVRQFWIGAKG